MYRQSTSYIYIIHPSSVAERQATTLGPKKLPKLSSLHTAFQTEQQRVHAIGHWFKPAGLARIYATIHTYTYNYSKSQLDDGFIKVVGVKK